MSEPMPPAQAADAAAPAPVPEGFRALKMFDDFVGANGPLYMRHERRPEGSLVQLGFRVERRHCNPMGICHGGMMATFCDMLLPITDAAMLVLGFPLGFFMSGIFSGAGNGEGAHRLGNILVPALAKGFGAYLADITYATGTELATAMSSQPPIDAAKSCIVDPPSPKNTAAEGTIGHVAAAK